MTFEVWIRELDEQTIDYLPRNLTDKTGRVSENTMHAETVLEHVCINIITETVGSELTATLRIADVLSQLYGETMGNLI